MTAPRPDDPDHGLDVDAAFAEIVARWREGDPAPHDEPADVSTPAPEPVEDRTGRDQPPPAPPEDPVGEDRERLARLFAPGWEERAEPPTPWEDEGHFVPPPPPPLPPVEPRRRLAWAALLGSPVLALVLVVLPVVVPRWASLLLVVAFVGGFGYLVATMRTAPPGDWSGDDGAVL